MIKLPSKRTLGLIINSFFYVINLSAYLILIKYIENTFDYNNFWFNTLLSCIVAPLYISWLASSENRKRIKLYGKAILFPFLAGFCFCFESILLYYSVNNLHLNYYTILRSSFIIWNVPFFIFFLKKQVSRLYWISCILLMISYSLSIYYYISLFGDSWKPTMAIIFSCFINASYNNVIEHSLKQYRIHNMDYQLIFQNTYFIIAIGPSAYYTYLDPPPISGTLILLFVAIAIMLQYFIYNKLVILRDNSSKIPSNVLMAGLDLVRRFILLLFSFLLFNEPINSYIIISLVLFIISSLLMFIDYLLPIFRNRQVDNSEEELELI